MSPDYPTLYRFDSLEVAIQTLAQARQLVWLTAKERATQFKSTRARVDALLTGLNPFGDPPSYVYDAQGQRRVRAWTGILELTLITAADYDYHWSYRSNIMDFMATLDGSNGLQDDPVNLPYHEVSRVWEVANNVEIMPQEGYFISKLQYSINFNVRSNAWPGGIENV